MRLFARILFLPVLVGSVSVAAAAAPDTAVTVRSILATSATPEELRANLLAFAREPRSAGAIGEAHYYRGVSFEREGQRDSAIASYRQALAIRATHEGRFRLLDALLLRRGPGDVNDALVIAELGWRESDGLGGTMQAGYQARRAWALYHAGNPDSARFLYAPLASSLSADRDWRFRMAQAQLAGGDVVQAGELLMPLAIASRREDREVMRMLKEAGDRSGAGARIESAAGKEVSERDKADIKLLMRMAARRIGFPSFDGFPLGAVIVPAASSTVRLPRPAIVIVSPRETFAEYDSLAFSLSRAGYMVVMLEARGGGRSVAPTCPLPETWAGREHRLQNLRARRFDRPSCAPTGIDGRYDAISRRRLGRHGADRGRSRGPGPTRFRVDSLEPCRRRRRSRPHGCSLGRAKRPTFFLNGPEDYDRQDWTERLYRVGERGASLVTEARTAGHGPVLFYFQPPIMARLRSWLDSAMPRGTRPKSPRSG